MRWSGNTAAELPTWPYATWDWIDRMFMPGPLACEFMHEQSAARESRGGGGLQPLDQAGVDQEPIEAPRLGAVGAGVEQSLAALEDLLLLREGGIERQAGRFLDDQRQIR